MAEALRERVLQVYAEVDAAVAAAAPRCVASGKCCRFAEYGHTLFLSRFEADILLEAAPDYATPVGRESCPFQVNGLCTTRDPRPLGCRIYFCDEAYTETGNAITEAAVAKLKRLADEFDAPWEYAPLHHFLNMPAQVAPSRIPLPLT